MAVDFTAIGYSDFPSNRHYPTRDKYTAQDESDYLTGWNSAKIDEQMPLEPEGRFTHFHEYK